MAVSRVSLSASASGDVCVDVGHRRGVRNASGARDGDVFDRGAIRHRDLERLHVAREAVDLRPERSIEAC
jgi:hypothetical protein